MRWKTRHNNAFLLLILMWVLLLFGMMAFAGCSRKTVYVPMESAAVRVDTVFQSRLVADTVIDRDTVRIEQRGDTILQTLTQWRWRTRERHDTVYKTSLDSVRVREPYEVEVVKTVERKLRWWEKGLMWAGALALLACAVRLWLAWRRR